MEKTDMVLVQTTVESRPQAETLAESVVVARLAACAQVSGPITSVYHWQGKMHKEQEHIVSMKTVHKQQTALTDYVCKQHPYTTPEIIVIPITYTSPAYFDWVLQSCSD